MRQFILGMYLCVFLMGCSDASFTSINSFGVESVNEVFFNDSSEVEGDLTEITATNYRFCREHNRDDEASVYHHENEALSAKNLHFGIVVLNKSVFINNSGNYNNDRVALEEAFKDGDAISGAFKKLRNPSGDVRFKGVNQEILKLAVSQKKLDALKAKVSTQVGLVMVLFDDVDANGVYNQGDTVLSSNYGIPPLKSPMAFSAGEPQTVHDFMIKTHLYEALGDTINQGFPESEGQCEVNDENCIEDTPERDCDDTHSPLAIDFSGNGFALTSAEDGVQFDIDADGAKDQIGWFVSQSDDALVVFDRDGDGEIAEDGSELFGTSTPLASGDSAANGFVALEQFDTDWNGKIDSNDFNANQLLLWFDHNHNGRAEVMELVPLLDKVESINLKYVAVLKKDSFGNKIMAESSVILNDGMKRNISDIWFKVKSR